MTADSSNSAVTHSGENAGGCISSPSGGATLSSSWTRRGIELDSSDPVTAVNSPVQSPVVDSPTVNSPVQSQFVDSQAVNSPVQSPIVDSPTVFSPVKSPIVDSPGVNSPVQSQFMDSPVHSQFVDSQAVNSSVQSPIVDSPAVILPVQSPEVDSPEVNSPSLSVYSPVQSPVEDLPVPSVYSPVQSPEVDFPAPEMAETQPEVSDGSNSCNDGGELRSVWSKPLANGVLEGTSSPVMNDSLWPALSESTRTGVKALSVSTESSPKPPSVSQAPVIPQLPQKQVKSNLNPNHARQRATRRGGSTGGASVNYNRPPLNPPPFPLFDIYGNLVPTVTEFPQPSFKTNNWSSRSSNKNPARRNNLGSRPVNIGYSGRRDHRGPPGPLVRGFVPPPFIPYQSLRPHLAPIGYESGASYVYVPVPLVPHGAIPYLDSSLHGSILKQIEYYFSDENLVKDNFLRSHMDDEGWVPITLIAGFQRVKKLTNDLQMILSSLAYSNTVEIQGDKVRRRADWRRWIHVPREVFGIEASFQKLKLEVGPTNEKLVVANGE